MREFLTPAGAIFSPCRTYRYALWRRWGRGPAVVFIGLNPSTADEKRDDPTIRRCIRFARDWGHEALVMLNLFALRSTDPRSLVTASDPIGEDNDRHIVEQHGLGIITIAAWGVYGGLRDRGRQVALLINPIGGVLSCLGHTKTGQPKHPLYLRADTRLERYQVF